MPQKPQAISGVSVGQEAVIDIRYPSISAGSLGQLIGRCLDSIPVRISGIKLSYLLCAPFAVVPALKLYFWYKLFGEKHVLTNRSVQRWKALGSQKLAQVALLEIAEIEIDELDGQQFYKAADLVLRDAAGNELMRLAGTVRPAVFRQTILEARDAHAQTEASLETIAARQSA